MRKLMGFLLVLGLLLATVGCDDSNKSDSTQIAEEPTTLVQNSSSSAQSNSDKNSTSTNNTTMLQTSVSDNTEDKYNNKQLKVLDCSEISLDGASTLVITFSTPLNPKQNFDNLLRLVDSEKGQIDGYWELSSNGLELRHRYLEPNRKLTLSIDRMLVATNESRLSESYISEITTQDRQAMVGFANNGVLLPSQSMSGLPVITLNVDNVDVNFFRIKSDKLYDFMQNYGSVKQLSVWSSEHALADADLVYSARFSLAPKRNVQEMVIINLANIDALKQEGTYIAVLSQAGTYKYSNPTIVFSISDIGISAHAYENGKLAVFAHSLSDGRALANISLTALCERKNEKCTTVTATTNEQGYAEISLNKQINYQILTASDAKQMTYIYLDRNGLDFSEFNLSGGTFYQKQLFTFGARDLYRPQETVYLNALLRDADGQLVPHQPIKAEIINPTGQIVKEFVWKSVNEQSGFYQTDYKIPATAATGRWAFKLNLGDDVYRYHYFSVEEFLPERMAVELLPTSSSPILNSENITFNIKGWYLYGAPAAGNDLQGRLYLSKQNSIDSLSGFKIGSVTETRVDRHLANVEQRLDNQGIASVVVESQNWQEIKSPIDVVLQASLLDAGGRPVTRTVSQSIWPAKKLPAIRALFADNRYYDWSLDRYVNRPTVEKGTMANFEVAYINSEGQKLAAETLLARFIRERRDYYWTWSDSQGWQAQYNQKEFIITEEKITINENETAKVSFLPDDWGSYRLEIVDPKSDVISSIRFWNGYNWEDNTAGSGAVRPDQVKLSLDKTAYKVGDIAKVRVEAPVSGSGYISLESNDGTLWMQKITVPEGGVNVDIPISQWGRHDIYINAMVVRPSTDSSVKTIKRAIGLLYLPIDTQDRQLNLTLDAPEKTQPERTLTVKLKVDDEQLLTNETITVLLSAVDSGVLNITNYQTPDPYSAFLGRKRYQVDQYDVYGKLIEGKGRNIDFSFGGDSDMALSQGITAGGKSPLSNVKIVAQQLQTVNLNEIGEAELELTIPDFNGELRLMAQVWDDNRFGRAEQKLLVASPIIAELSMPRFLSGGDRTIIALELHNLTSLEQDIEIDLMTEGLITFTNDNSQKMNLAPQERKVVQIPIIADYGFGEGTVNIKVSNIQLSEDEVYQLSRSWSLGIRPAYAADSHTFAVALNKDESWTLPTTLLTDLIDNTIESELIIAQQPPINIAQYIKTLFAYPYGCLEQTISGLSPSLYVNQVQLESMNIDSESDEERREKIQIGIDRILTMQRNNGSFGLWSKENDEEHWLTAYAVDFLLQAQERGYQVNNQALDKAFDRLAQYLYDNSAFYNVNSYYDNDVNEYIQFSTKTYSALLLAKQNKITPAIRNELKRLYQQVKSNDSTVALSPLPITQLAIASRLAGYKRSANDLMKIALQVNRDSNYYWLGDYGSSIRDKAAIYTLMVNYKIAPQKQASYLLDLANEIRGKKHFSTQELNALFMAGWLSQNNFSNKPFTVNINQQEAMANNQLTRSFDYEYLNKGLTITNNNSEPIYLHFVINGYPIKAPVATNDDSQLTISQQYFDTQGNPLVLDKLNVGDSVIVLTDVYSRYLLTDALVVDLLPAGLEIENQNLTNSNINIQSIPELADLMKYESVNDIKYQEFRDDRFVAAIDIHNYYSKGWYRTRLMYLVRAVTPGDYIMPAPYVESMYHPEWFAVGKTPYLISVLDPRATIDQSDDLPEETQ